MYFWMLASFLGKINISQRNHISYLKVKTCLLKMSDFSESSTSISFKYSAFVIKLNICKRQRLFFRIQVNTMFVTSFTLSCNKYQCANHFYICGRQKVNKSNNTTAQNIGDVSIMELDDGSFQMYCAVAKYVLHRHESGVHLMLYRSAQEQLSTFSNMFHFNAHCCYKMSHMGEMGLGFLSLLFVPSSN